MRFALISAVLAVTLLLELFANVKPALGTGYYGGITYYYPAPTVMYYRPYQSFYYARPMYYYYSYSSPCITYAPQAYSEPSYRYERGPSSSYQQPAAREYSSEPSSTARPTTIVTVGAYDNRFEPQTINVQPGTTVRWVNYGQHPHTVTADDDSWDSGDIQPDASYSATFNRPGTYYYYCRHHSQDRMRGVVIVGSSADNGGGGARSRGY
jgi:plastocyanin